MSARDRHGRWRRCSAPGVQRSDRRLCTTPFGVPVVPDVISISAGTSTPSARPARALRSARASPSSDRLSGVSQATGPSQSFASVEASTRRCSSGVSFGIDRDGDGACGPGGKHVEDEGRTLRLPHHHGIAAFDSACDERGGAGTYRLPDSITRIPLARAHVDELRGLREAGDDGGKQGCWRSFGQRAVRLLFGVNALQEFSCNRNCVEAASPAKPTIAEIPVMRSDLLDNVRHTFVLRTREIVPALRFLKPGCGKRRMAATSSKLSKLTRCHAPPAFSRLSALPAHRLPIVWKPRAHERDSRPELPAQPSGRHSSATLA